MAGLGLRVLTEPGPSQLSAPVTTAGLVGPRPRSVQSVNPTRRTADSPKLSLAEYAILAVVGERPQHGFAVARLLASEGEIGEVYAVARPRGIPRHRPAARRRDDPTA